MKPAFHDTDIDTDSPDTPASLRPTHAISWSYYCGKLHREVASRCSTVARHADILATILARMSSVSVSWNAGLSKLVDAVELWCCYCYIRRSLRSVWVPREDVLFVRDGVNNEGSQSQRPGPSSRRPHCTRQTDFPLSRSQVRRYV